MGWLPKFIRYDVNDANRQRWLAHTLASLPTGVRILDAGAGELRNKPLCRHLNYVSQDICQYKGTDGGEGLHLSHWDTSKIDLVCDITMIPEPDESFDAILCSEVLEHVPEPLRVLDEFARLLKPDGSLILTAPFNSLVHFAPHYFYSGYSKFWYEHHLPARGFKIKELTANGDWFSCLRQEAKRLPSMSRRFKNRRWPLATLASGLFILIEALARNAELAPDVACFGWHCVAVREPQASGLPST